MTLEELNAADRQEAFHALRQCCGSEQWANQMLAGRPFSDKSSLLRTANLIWHSLNEQDWLQAFAHHPKIGERTAAKWSSEEQNGMNHADRETVAELARLNLDYERKFGRIFLVCATGKSARELLAQLQSRIGNEPEHELRIAADEQAKITKIRLEKLLSQ